ncbi:hypothetical protein FRAAL6087 [Frankia alni ACN14a]|uniref:Uncharacterized protein n=1 Tax=Frankia alni (strain DSM 45986 / CECT 9034 / ACN14a) TaxID=326424 RepID=Q0RCW3_FRAAA|nr:hypothetical protein FRAAL6087 [Frankia alni ACN14a]
MISDASPAVPVGHPRVAIPLGMISDPIVKVQVRAAVEGAVSGDLAAVRRWCNFAGQGFDPSGAAMG